MTARRGGRRVGAAVPERRGRAGHPGRRHKSRAGRGKSTAVTRRERRHVMQLLACGSIFIFLVAVKLLLPAKMAQFNDQLADALRQNMDVRAVFSAVGEAFAGQRKPGDALEEVYQAVFHPQMDGEAMETAARLPAELRSEDSAALRELQAFRKGQAAADMAEDTEPPSSGAALACVLYSDRNLPENVSMEQAILGFDYCTPVSGAMSSNFGYRDHPVEGEERFHYGVDIAADTGTAVACFADGTVTAVGESSSYGKYVMVRHTGGYHTLYAHCSRITASSGAAVKKGDKIAEVGETGIATGPHLHFELQHKDTYLNPVYYVALE